MLNSLTNFAATYYSYGSSSSLTAGEEATIFATFFGLIAAMFIPIIILCVILIIAQWKIFTKAGREGWKAIIPFYNMYVLTEISGQNGLLFLLCFVPGVGALIWTILVSLKLAPAFGKDSGFAVGLILLGPIFQMILGFGSAQYQLGGAQAPAAGAAPVQNPAPQPQKPEDPWVSGNQQQ